MSSTSPPAEPSHQPVDRTGSNLGELGCLGALVVFFSFFGWRVSKKRLSSGEEREGGGDD